MEDVTGQGPQPNEAPINSEPSGPDEIAEALAASKRQRRIFFLSFGTILFMGLALAILYLGGRVMETKAAGTSVPKSQPVAAPAVAQPPIIAAAKTGPMPLPPAIAETKIAETKATLAPKPEVIAKAVVVPETKPPAFGEAKNAPGSKPAAAADAKNVASPKPAAVAEAKNAPGSKPAAVADAKSVPSSKPVAVAEAKNAPTPKPPAAIQAQTKPNPQTNPPVIAKTQTVKAVPVASVVPARTAREESIIDGNLPRAQNPYDGPLLKPHSGDTYVQVGAYSPNYTPSFLQVLEKRGFHPVVAPGPAADVYRVLIGPFGDHTAMKSAFSQIQKAGISDAFDRMY